MTEQQFTEKWAALASAEAADLAAKQAAERARIEARLRLRLEDIADKVRESHARPKALLIHEALCPDKHGRALKQERLAEITGVTQQVVSDYAMFGHFIFYTSSERINPTLRQPLFFERLTLSHFLRLLSRTESQAGPRSARDVRQADYERRFREVIDHVNAGAGQALTREQIYPALEALAGRKKPTPLAAVLQRLEQEHPDSPVTARDLNVAVGSFKKRSDYFTEVVDSVAGPAVRVRKLAKVDPGRAQTALAEVGPLLEQIIELAQRTTAATSLAQISANAQKVLRAVKDMQTWAQTQPQ